MATFRRLRRLLDAYRFPGFRPLPSVVGIFGEPGVRVVALVRRSKNGVRDVRPRPRGVVRPEDSAGPP